MEGAGQGQTDFHLEVGQARICGKAKQAGLSEGCPGPREVGSAGVSLMRLSAPVDGGVPWAEASKVEERRSRVVWCAVGPEEQRKCVEWSSQSPMVVACATAATTEDCIALILVGRPRWEPVACAAGAVGSAEDPRWWASVHFRGAGRASPGRVSSPAPSAPTGQLSAETPLLAGLPLF